MITPDLSIGSTFGDYRLEAVAGRGGMGVVFRATELALGRTVALKVIASDLAQELDFRQRFQRELSFVVALEHPNVVPVYRAGEVDNVLYIAMRYIRGTDLRELLADRGPMSPHEAGRVIAQIGAALDEAHSMGLVHRDVKPANVIVDARGSDNHVYLTDFGLSKHVTSTGALTHPGVWVGTPNYIAPEQVLGMPVNARADVYSLTCLLFETLAGQVPYPRENEMATLFAHVQDDPPSLLAVAPHLPERLEDVIRRGMAKKQEERYPSAGDLAEATVAAIQGRPVVRSERVVAQGRAALSSPDLMLPSTQEYGDRPQQLDAELAETRLPERPRRERMETIVRGPGVEPHDQPSEPSQPSRPGEAAEPGRPDVVAEPGRPDVVAEPSQPGPPSAPSAPSRPDQAREPSQPSRPDQAREPSAPGRPLDRTTVKSPVVSPTPPAEPRTPAPREADVGSGAGREPAVTARSAEPAPTPDDSRPSHETVVRLPRVDGGSTGSGEDPITGARRGGGAPVAPGPVQRGPVPSAGAPVLPPPPAPSPPSREAPKSRRNLVVAIVLVALLAIGGAAAVLAGGGGDEDEGGGGASAGGGAQSAELSLTPVGAGPSDVVVDANGAWVASTTAKTVSRLNLRTGRVTGEPVKLEGSPDKLASDGETVFALDSTGGVIYGIDEGSGESTGDPWRFTADDLATGFDSLWVVNGTSGRLRRVDPERVEPASSIDVGDHPISVAAGASAIAVLNGDSGTVSRVDPDTEAVIEPDAQVGKESTDVAVDLETAWVANPASGQVVRVDELSSDDPQTTPIAVPGATFVAVGNGAIWVTGDNKLTRIDPESNEVVGEPVDLGFTGAVAASDDAVWVVNPDGDAVARVPY
jgi:serine/threonine protein kinase